MIKLLLILSLTLSGCSLLQSRPPVKEVSIYTIPTLPRIKLPAPIAQPDLTVPVPMDVTAEEVDYYREVCDAHESGEYTKEELITKYNGLPQGNACDWVVRGYSIQGWLNVESKLALGGTYSQQLRDRITFLEGVIKDLEEVANKQETAIKKIK